MTNAVAIELRAFTFVLPSDSRVATVENTNSAIRAGLTNADALCVEVSQVADADAAIVQLLLHFQRELTVRGGRFTLQSPSPGMQEAIRLAGAELLLCAD